MSKTILLILIFISFNSCKKPLNYKFSNLKNLNLNCSQIKSNLVKEAYYSFREDLVTYAIKNNKTDSKNLPLSLALFIVNGALGEADFKNIASNHTKIIVSKLAKENQLWNNDKSLNYHSIFITCLINNIKNTEIKNAILLYREGRFNKEELVEIYRVNIREANTDSHFAMFITFESYYQYLNKLDLTNYGSP